VREANAAANTWAWLTAGLNAWTVEGRGSVWSVWDKVRAGFLKQVRLVRSEGFWPDHWLAHGCGAAFGYYHPYWALAEGMDSWPLFGMDQLPLDLGAEARSGRHDRLAALLGAGAPLMPQGDPAVDFERVVKSSTRFRDVAETQANQVRAWLSTGFGPVISGAAFAQNAFEHTGPLSEAIVDRFGQTLHLAGQHPADQQLAPSGEAELIVLYNGEVRDGVVSARASRIGQTLDWRWHWGWLAHPIPLDDTLAMVQLTAQLLRSPAVLLGLYRALDANEPGFDRLALCVLRRWLLTLQALTWLEDALQHTWHWTRPEDLVVFAFSALRPSWPRPAVAISHRSGDAKPALQRLGMWRSPFASIDASFVPSWEMNLGMIWGLFSAAPVIVRVRTPTYLESEWCNREWELTEYLADQSDFMRGRQIVDIPLEALESVEDLVQRAAVNSYSAASQRYAMPEEPSLPPFLQAPFPPQALVLTAHPLPVQTALVLRAAGALRLFRFVLRDPDAVNFLAALLVRGEDPNIPVPTNNPDGWAPYAAVFRDLATLAEQDFADGSPLRVSAMADDDELGAVAALFMRIPDLRQYDVDVGDLLAALEWYRTILVWYLSMEYGDQIVIDIRGLTRDQWSSHPSVSHMRGMTQLPADCPIWVLQEAGQNAHEWPHLDELPLLTEHLVSQFEWMQLVYLASTWPVLYDGLADLTMTDRLKRAFWSSVSAEHLQVGDKLGPEQVFAVAADAFGIDKFRNADGDAVSP
jgi:hypothetical protein